ncbi:glycoside hydrolase family 57 protein [Methanolobus sediminis]|uniref:Glycoside hydrolase family 57 protein n=1 Tax=Methanolobus sediminis TaxID=3072978 RepID=A0AA51YM10_9EURY|nr:glycoside hydrolase family 57 protein [Methanolobus sediminis]WMW25467.1 glycoside hydrolase family 57 protein [Methanolobus sediminis]
MNSICPFFEVHQPYRLRWFWPDHKQGFERYFDETVNKEIFRKVAGKCYIPANRTLLELADNTDGYFRASMSVTGTLLEQCMEWGEDVLELFKDLAETGCIEFIDETCYHSLASLFESKDEFMDEVKEHRNLMSELIGVKPRIFRNTEMLYNNSVAYFAAKLGYDAILTEGIETILHGRSPDHVYKARHSDIAVLLRNYKLSDDIGYRFSSRWWEEYPLTASKWADWASWKHGETLNIFMDYETFGEHQWKDTGIFEFLKALPGEVKDRGMRFLTPSQTIDAYKPVGEIDVGDFSTVSWADIERDTSAWLGNDMQRRCFEEMKLLEPYVRKTNDPELLRIWKHMLTSDHYYYMSTKWLGDGDVHSYFSIHNSPYDAAVNFMAALNDFKSQVFRTLNLPA